MRVRVVERVVKRMKIFSFVLFTLFKLTIRLRNEFGWMKRESELFYFLDDLFFNSKKLKKLFLILKEI